jgi:hypothetical protein
MSYPKHVDWFNDTGEILQTTDGKDVKIWEFNHYDDEAILSEWATHFRNQYCDDLKIDILREGTDLSRLEFLTKNIFPEPSIKSGDFGEILVADFLEFLNGYWIPRLRYNQKPTPNESTRGTDVIGFKKDELIIVEVKSKFTKPNNNVLQNAINDSNKDSKKDNPEERVRYAESLNYFKSRYIEQNDIVKANQISRFQNLADNPFILSYGAYAVVCNSIYDESIINNANTSNHSASDDLSLLVFKGEDMMDLVNKLYERAANEA